MPARLNRNISTFRGLDDRACAWTKLCLRRDLFRFPDLLPNRKHLRIEHRGNEAHGNLQQVPRSLLRFELDDDVVDARLTGETSLAVIRADVRERRDLDRHVLDDVTKIRAFFETLYKTATPAEANDGEVRNEVRSRTNPPCSDVLGTSKRSVIRVPKTAVRLREQQQRTFAG